jgi:hypothetical protein
VLNGDLEKKKKKKRNFPHALLLGFDKNEHHVCVLMIFFSPPIFPYLREIVVSTRSA